LKILVEAYSLDEFRLKFQGWVPDAKREIKTSFAIAFGLIFLLLNKVRSFTEPGNGLLNKIRLGG